MGEAVEPAGGGADLRARAVTVYAGSSRRSPAGLLALARDLGRGIAERGWVLVYGGARIGLMGALADAALAAGGRVEGVILDTFARVAHASLHALETVADMRSRKAGLAHRGDAYVVLPGGFGTLEELSEILVERQLGLHEKPLVLVNHEGFWDPLLAQIDRQVADGLVKEAYRALLTVVPDAEAALAAIARSPAADRGRSGGASDLAKLA
ncbi:MAG TPA: TIGR00730 family Rossman fold protein [Candidatus Binatia bacterium]|nr:TIGR00730 family Rossman fold protein [Candidatus Binatia bacterium]